MCVTDHRKRDGACAQHDRLNYLYPDDPVKTAQHDVSTSNPQDKKCTNVGRKGEKDRSKFTHADRAVT